MIAAWKSRKFLLTAFVVIMCPIIPIIYAKLGVNDSITQIVVGAMAGTSGLYGFANSWGKKNASSD